MNGRVVTSIHCVCAFTNFSIHFGKNIVIRSCYGFCSKGWYVTSNRYYIICFMKWTIYNACSKLVIQVHFFFLIAQILKSSTSWKRSQSTSYQSEFIYICIQTYFYSSCSILSRYMIFYLSFVCSHLCFPRETMMWKCNRENNIGTWSVLHICNVNKIYLC